jgi:hypothetical protein
MNPKRSDPADQEHISTGRQFFKDALHGGLFRGRQASTRSKAEPDRERRGESEDLPEAQKEQERSK